MNNERTKAYYQTVTLASSIPNDSPVRGFHSYNQYKSEMVAIFLTKDLSL